MVKQKSVKGPSSTLPTEIISYEILARLPVKSLLKCRCVSKLWCSIIDDPSFALTHLKICQNDNSKLHLLVLEPPRLRSSKQLCAIRNGKTFRKMISFDIDLNWHQHYQAVGYVNGLVCMKKYGTMFRLSQIILWNPSIKKALELPNFHSSSVTNVIFRIDCVFGYDAVKNDYKVVASLYLDNELRAPNFVKIFTLSTFSWKTVDIGSTPCIWRKCGPNVSLDGVIYWVGIDIVTSQLGKLSHFVSFDVANDVFKYIELPDYKNDTGDEWPGDRFPIILDESIGLMENFKSYSQIWIMEKLQGNTQSWTKRFTINLQLLNKCLHFKKDGELLFSDSEHKGRVNSYNIKSQEIKVLAKCYRNDPIFISDYMESLALLDRSTQKTSTNNLPYASDQQSLLS